MVGLRPSTRFRAVSRLRGDRAVAGAPGGRVPRVVPDLPCRCGKAGRRRRARAAHCRHVGQGRGLGRAGGWGLGRLPTAQPTSFHV
ncbi:MAG: hypothetical protein MZV64_15275 [Ignavibacteriales bacterium]|nr:hypothetical protein [Ignavibacteriales bacterium]